jgi:LysM repeat protein
MASLTAHLVETGDHGRLGFHPDCPACRQVRLLGSLSADAVISRRAQAALASGVLAISAVGPSAALAQEPDHQVEGGLDSAPDGGTSDTGAESVPPSTLAPPPAADLDPQTPDGPEASDLQEVVPVQTEPVEAPDPDAPSSGAQNGLAPEPVDTETSRPEGILEPVDPDSPAETPAPAQPTSEELATQVPDEPVPEGQLEAGPDALSDEKTAETSPRDHTALSPVDSDAEQAPASPPAVPAPMVTEATVVAAAPSEAPPVDKPADSEPADRSSTRDPDFLVVQAGDSLWSIAKRVLGPDATPAQIARKVSRLWNLNGDRIGTGRPDLILVGTKLRLR